MSESRIHQEIALPFAPQRIYDALTCAKQLSAMAGGAPTELDARDGGAFSCFGGMIVGRQIEGVPGQRLVLAWRVKSWEPGLFSIARFELKADAGGTKIDFDHIGFPEGQAEHLGKGWHANYWEPLRKVLG